VFEELARGYAVVSVAVALPMFCGAQVGLVQTLNIGPFPCRFLIPCLSWYHYWRWQNKYLAEAKRESALKEVRAEAVKARAGTLEEETRTSSLKAGAGELDEA
jgi:hypothetical protein